MKSSISKALPVILAALTLAFGGNLAVAAKAAGKSVKVTLNPQNNSGESGTATLIPIGANKTRVIVNLKGEPRSASQPAHIHQGPCATLNPAPKWPLHNIQKGHSISVVPVGISTITSGTYAINVHRSASDIKTYVACGDIPGDGGMSGGGMSGGMGGGGMPGSK
jgi:hypothetical protein